MTKFLIVCSAAIIIMGAGFINMAVAGKSPGETKPPIEIAEVADIKAFHAAELKKRADTYCDKGEAFQPQNIKGVSITFKWIAKRCSIIIEEEGVQSIAPAY